MEEHALLSQKVSHKEDIDYVFLFHGYTIVVLKNGTNEVIDLPMTAIERLLRGQPFFRIHRSYLVNLDRVSELSLKKNKLMIRMRGQELPVSRRKKRELLALLGAVN